MSQRNYGRIDTPDIASLLNVASSSEPRIRRQAFDILTRLPLAPSAEANLEKAALRALDAGAPTEDDIRIFAEIDSDSIRKRLRKLLEKTEARAAVARELARRGDADATSRLAEELERTERRRVELVEALAESHADPGALEEVTSKFEAGARFWIALARARSGDAAPIVEVASGDEFPPARGGVGELIERIRAHGPYPPAVVQALETEAPATNLRRVLLEGMETITARPTARPRKGGDRRRANELVRQWLDRKFVFDPHGRVDEKEKELAAAASPDLLGSLAATLFRAAAGLEGEAQIIAGNEVVDLVTRAKTVEPDPATLLDLYESLDERPLLRTQIAWTAQRCGLPKILRQLGPEAAGGRWAALDLLTESIRWSESPTEPYFGGASAPVARRRERRIAPGASLKVPPAPAEPALAAEEANEIVVDLDDAFFAPYPGPGGSYEVATARAGAEDDVGAADLEILSGESAAAAGPGDLAEAAEPAESLGAPPPPPPGAPRPAATLARGTTDTGDDVPRRMYALAEAPGHVVMSEPFTLRVGTTKLPPSPDAEPMEVPAGTPGVYTLTITLQAPGFRIEGGESLFELPVTRQNPYPKIDLRLRPRLQDQPRVEREIAVFFSVDGQVIGAVSLKIVVHHEANDETRAAQKEVWNRMFSTPTYDVPPDLTVMVTEDRTGGLAWSFITPHAAVPIVRVPLHTSAGHRPREFAENLINQVNRRDPQPGVFEFLVGIGTEVARLIPGAFWETLEEVASAAGTKAPSVLIISNEPYVPWELATMPSRLDPAVSPFLGAQARVGRWIVGDRLPPPRMVAVKTAAVVRGRYTLPGWSNLEKALEEADAIALRWKVAGVDATELKILGLLKATPCSDLLHFAMHGQCDDRGALDGLITTDGSAVAPASVAGAMQQKVGSGIAAGTPFVFLNACQLGSGSRMLGDYSGMAAEFVRGGAAGVVAPLWSIRDDVAKQVALDFYEATLDRGELAAEVIRRERARFAEGTSPTYLAYQFFGHPSLRLDGASLRKEP